MILSCKALSKRDKDFHVKHYPKEINLKIRIRCELTAIDVYDSLRYHSLEFNHSAPQGAFSSQPRPHSTADQRSKIERKSICAHNTWFLLTCDDLFYLHTTIILFT